MSTIIIVYVLSVANDGINTVSNMLPISVIEVLSIAKHAVNGIAYHLTIFIVKHLTVTEDTVNAVYVFHLAEHPYLTAILRCYTQRYYHC